MQRFVLCSYSMLSMVYFIEGGFGFVGFLNRQEVCTVFLSHSIVRGLSTTVLIRKKTRLGMNHQKV